jgi:hypothetical protein
MSHSPIKRAKAGLSGSATARRVTAAEKAAQPRPKAKPKPKKKKSVESSVRDVFWGGE